MNLMIKTKNNERINIVFALENCLITAFESGYASIIWGTLKNRHPVVLC